MSKKYTFKPDLEGLNEEMWKIIDNKIDPPFTKKEQYQRLYELFCEYLGKNTKLKIDSMLIDLEDESENMR
jgi:hypothetical protein